MDTVQFEDAISRLSEMMREFYSDAVQFLAALKKGIGGEGSPQ
jgi:hypothetical protein